MPAPSRAIALYGTEEEVAAPRVLTAGRLTAELEAGNLRYVRWDGEEVLRAVSFIVRDRDWGTYAPRIEALEVDEREDGFDVTYRAEAGKGETFSFEARIQGRSDGTLRFHGTGASETGFETNRTGFVILHPIEGVAGAPAGLEHVDGRTREGAFPRLIDPVQPMMDLRALSHRTPGGIAVRVLMEGDTYEMEDQRNWTDASYKTYVRPLAKPWPYRIEPGETVDQTITVTVSGRSAAGGAAGAVALVPGEAMGEVPPLGIGLRPETAGADLAAAGALRAMAPAHAILHHDPRAGHDATTLRAALEAARAMGADPWLEAVIESTDDAGAAQEVAALGRLAADLGSPFAVVLVSPAPDLKCTLPGSVWPEAPEAARLYAAARAAFPQARIGGGMFSYFTELNRKRPPAGALDLVSFTTCPMVHAGDDRSLLETREAHGAVAASVSAIADGTPWAVGPSSIGMRDNPYGEATKENPGNLRQAMNRADPRQRGLLGAAWTLAYASDFAAGGASAVAIGGATGPFGVLRSPSDGDVAWFDDGGLYPAFHVMRGLARLRGAPMLRMPASGPVAALAARTRAGTEIWAANMGAAPVEISAGPASASILDAASFADAARDPAHMDALSDRSDAIAMDAYAIARILLKG